MARLREKDELADREFILNMAASLIRQHGFKGMTTRKVAQACGMLPGSLHYRYRTKEAIVVDLMKLAMERSTTAIESACRGINDPLLRVRMGLRAHLETLVSGNDIVYVLLFEWRALEGQARAEMIALRDEYEQFWLGMIKGVQEQGLLRQDLSVSLLKLLSFGAVNWVATWYRASGPMTLDQIADTIWVMVTQGVLVPEAHALAEASRQ